MVALAATLELAPVFSKAFPVKVEFVLTNPLLVSHYLPVVRALGRRGIDAAMVTLPRSLHWRFFQRGKLALYEACIDALQRVGTPFRTEIDPNADIALTVLGSNMLHLYRRHKLKFRYGVGLLRTGLHYNRSMTQGFDGALLHGPYEQRLFSRWLPPERTRIMGIPRHDAYFRDRPSKQAARERLSPLQRPLRPVLAYLPTWDEHSSLERFHASLVELARTHLLIVKPHSLSALSRSALLALDDLRTHSALVLDSEHTFADVVGAADLVVADAKSGATPEAVLLATDTPLVTLSTCPVSEFYPELQLAGPCVDDPRQLAGAVRGMLRLDTYLESRRALRTQLFHDNQGHAADAAAEAIIALSRLEKRSTSPSRLERTFPAPYRIVRGRVLSLKIKLGI